jgi:hypothetical protein
MLGDTLSLLGALGLALTIVGLLLSQYKDLKRIVRRANIAPYIP